MIERSWTTTFRLEEKPGHIGIDERGPKDERGYYSSDMLLKQDTEADINITFDIDDGSDSITLRLSLYHAKNPETERAFHVHVLVNFNAAEMDALQKYLSFLVSKP